MNKINDLSFYIGYDPKEDLAYRVCKYSLKKRSTIKTNIFSLKLDELVSRRLTLEDVNEAFKYMKEGSVARSVMMFD